MILDVEVAGRSHAVEVRRGDGRRGGTTQVVLDGRTVEVDARRIGRRWSLLIGGRSYEIAVADEPGGITIVHVNGHAVPATCSRAGTRFGAAARRARGLPDAPDGPLQVVAPMPGRIVRVLVRTGDAVAAGQGLVVIEAMKMENELRSAKAGRVAEVRVAEGATVEARTVLMVVE